MRLSLTIAPHDRTAPRKRETLSLVAPPGRGSRERGACRRRPYRASLAAFTGRAFNTLRAGFALKVIGSLVNGLIPCRSFVAGFLMTTNLAKPGRTNRPFFFSSL